MAVAENFIPMISFGTCAASGARELYDGIPVSSSEIITSLDRSIVPMEFIEIHAAINEYDAHRMILDKDPYAYHSMNMLDYLIGNTDRHRANWGFWIDNDTNTIRKLHPLMDFNKAFTSYDTIDGARCQTVPGNVSQRDAAIEAVRRIGLNQTAEVKREWFPDEATWQMFSKRLELLRNV